MLGRAIGMMDTQHKALSWVCAALFATGFLLSLAGHYMNCSGAEILPIPYLYCGPMVFICAITLLTLVKNTLDTRTVRGLGLISRHSLGIYGFHALIIHALRTRGLSLKTGQYSILFGSFARRWQRVCYFLCWYNESTETD